jgi:N-acetylmuramic acid 6-phosphate etherase
MTITDTAIEKQKHLRHLVTESSNPDLAELDSLDTLERLQLMNAEDALVAAAVRLELPHVVEALKGIVHSFRTGGRLIYVGAGTSGRLGILDASECPPTFGTDPDLVTAIIAGGPTAMFAAVEGAEDDPERGVNAIEAAGVGKHDSVVGISASGQAPFVIGALNRAVELGANTIALTNNRPSKIERIATVTIAPIVGPEAIAGSTRMKAGTAQKMVLNLLSTNAMIEIGKTYGNLMVDVKTSNSKLVARALRIIIEVTGVNQSVAAKALTECGGNAKQAIVLLETGLSPAEAENLLQRNSGFLRKALQHHDKSIDLN